MCGYKSVPENGRTCRVILYTRVKKVILTGVIVCDAADEWSDDVQSQLSADVADDDEEEEEDEDGAGSCYSSADNQSLNSAAEKSAQCRDDAAQSQLPSSHQTNNTAAAAAAALISDQYSVETLLANVQALLKLAMDSVRHREQQASIKAGQ